MQIADLIRQQSGQSLGQFFAERTANLGPLGFAMGDIASEVPVYVVDTICEHLFAGVSQETWDLSIDFPRCLPPHADVFVEMCRPSMNRSELYGNSSSALLPHRWGWFISCRNRRNLPLEARAEQARRLSNSLLQEAGDRLDEAAVDSALRDRDPIQASKGLDVAERRLFVVKALAGEKLTIPTGALPPGRPPTAPGWMLRATPICWNLEGLRLPLVSIDLDLDEAGTAASAPFYFLPSRLPDRAWGWDAMQGVMRLLYPALLALSLANSGQAVIRRHDSPAALNRHRKRRGKPQCPPRWSIERRPVDRQ